MFAVLSRKNRDFPTFWTKRRSPEWFPSALLWLLRDDVHLTAKVGYKTCEWCVYQDMSAPHLDSNRSDLPCISKISLKNWKQIRWFLFAPILVDHGCMVKKVKSPLKAWSDLSQRISSKDVYPESCKKIHLSTFSWSSEWCVLVLPYITCKIHHMRHLHFGKSTHIHT